MFNVLLSTNSQKFLKKADKQIYERLTYKIKELTVNPFPSDIKRIVNSKHKLFRVRVGDYRIEYTVIHDKNEIFIVDIDKRSRIYNK
jgi:mRNA interferase RelE/StbE